MPVNKISVNAAPPTICGISRQLLEGRWLEAALVLLVSQLAVNMPIYLVKSITDSVAAELACLLYELIIGAPISLGICMYFLRVLRRLPGGIKDLRDGFGRFSAALGLYVRLWLYTFLWSLLFIIPGILAAIRYSQAWFILADDPRKDPGTCIEESKYMMNGNMVAYFLLLLSFIGWGILASVPQIAALWLTAPEFFGSIQHMAQNGEYQIAPFVSQTNIWIELAGLAAIFLYVYIYAAQACFYDLLTGNITVMQQSGAYYGEDGNGSL